MAAAPDLGSGAVRRVGSSPITRTDYLIKDKKEDVSDTSSFFFLDTRDCEAPAEAFRIMDQRNNLRDFIFKHII